MTDQPTTSGVQDLIERLSKEGVAEGQRQGEHILGDAQRKADEILQSARKQADAIVEQAREEADKFQAAGEEALKLAARDSVRDFAARIHEGFRNRLQDLVRHQLSEPKLIKRMILDITRQATAELSDEGAEIVLPTQVVAEEDVRKRIQAGDPDALTQFVQGLIGQDLREGFSISLGSQSHAGMTVRVANQNVEIDLTEEAIAELLAEHLLPRFRAVMRKT
jgi:V/A-type H+-transporting ATPase subunit E